MSNPNRGRGGYNNSHGTPSQPVQPSSQSAVTNPVTSTSLPQANGTHSPLPAGRGASRGGFVSNNFRGHGGRGRGSTNHHDRGRGSTTRGFRGRGSAAHTSP